MNEFDEKEYQTVIPAAMLHNIGKFLHLVVYERTKTINKTLGLLSTISNEKIKR